MQAHGRYQEENQALEALKNFERAEKLGNVRALYQIGCLYEWGNGVQKDVDKAVEYYERAQRAGCKAASYNLRQLRPKEESKEEEDETESDFVEDDS